MTPDPDAWWASLPLERRQQIYRWIEQPSAAGEIPGQEAMFDPVSLPLPSNNPLRKVPR